MTMCSADPIASFTDQRGLVATMSMAKHYAKVQNVATPDILLHHKGLDQLE